MLFIVQKGVEEIKIKLGELPNFSHQNKISVIIFACACLIRNLFIVRSEKDIINFSKSII